MRGWLAALAMVVPACDGDGEGEDDAMGESSSGGEAFDEAAVVARALTYASELVRINTEDRASQHGLADTVNVYVDPDVADLYRSLDPEASGPLIAFPAGALLVKEHLDEGGAAVGLTIMAQGDPSSSSGGWWWGRVDGTGTLQDRGQVGFCIDCHRAVESEGWVFGVPADNR